MGNRAMSDGISETVARDVSEAMVRLLREWNRLEEMRENEPRKALVREGA